MARFGVAICLLAVLTLISCDLPPATSVDSDLGLAESNMISGRSTTSELEPNDTFRRATPVAMQESTSRRIQGRLNRWDDVDVYDLGACLPGDRIRVDFASASAEFRARAAVFDDRGRAMFISPNPYLFDSSNIPQLVDFVVRRASSRVLLVVSAMPGHREFGEYMLNPRIGTGEGAPLAQGQTIVLDFDGGAPRYELAGVSEIRPFDAAALGAENASQTETMRKMIIATFSRCFAEFAVNVVTSDEPAPSGSVSVIYIGSAHPSALGVSQNVDGYNLDPCDDGVVFAESFTAGTFGLALPTEDLAMAIGQVAAHEAGHLLGLHHVHDAAALMDEASTTRALLNEQYFKTAPLSDSVFPIGVQDDVMWLTEIVGAANYNSLKLIGSR